MIITDTIFKSYGLPIAGEIPAQRLTAAIRDAENLIIRRSIGDANYKLLGEMQPTSEELAGGEIVDAEGVMHFVVGAHCAISYIAFAYLLSYDVIATNFGSVRKVDDKSEHVNTLPLCRQFLEAGEVWMQELCEAKGWKWKSQNLVFRKLL